MNTLLEFYCSLPLTSANYRWWKLLNIFHFQRLLELAIKGCWQLTWVLKDTRESLIKRNNIFFVTIVWVYCFNTLPAYFHKYIVKLRHAGTSDLTSKKSPLLLMLFSMLLLLIFLVFILLLMLLLLKGFPNALLKLQEMEIFLFGFFRKTAENENLRYLILLQNCGKL